MTVKRGFRPACAILAVFLMLFLPASPASGAPRDIYPASLSLEPEVSLYPLKDAPELSYWSVLPSAVQTFSDDIGQLEGVQYWAQQAGANISFISVSASAAKESFNAMLAGGALPDIIEYSWLEDFAAEKAYQDGVIADITPFMSDWAPFLKGLLDQYEDIARRVKTDNGRILFFPSIRGWLEPISTEGPIMQGGLDFESPVTIDDWDVLLRALKNEHGFKYPLTGFDSTPGSAVSDLTIARMFAGAFNAYPDFYIDGTSVKHGLLEPGFRDFLVKMNEWIREGLLDPDFAICTPTDTAFRMLSGASAVSFGTAENILAWQSSADRTPGISTVFIGADYPVTAERVQTLRREVYGVAPSGHAAISTACKDVETAMRVLDYAYTEQGHKTVNFGRLGYSYAENNGMNEFTELILNNPERLKVVNAIGKYTRSGADFPGILSFERVRQLYGQKIQWDAVQTWTRIDASVQPFSEMPPVSLTFEENREFTRIMTAVNSYAVEEIVKFIKGTRSMEDFNLFVKKLKSMGLSDAVNYQQSALARYYTR